MSKAAFTHRRQSSLAPGRKKSSRPPAAPFSSTRSASAARSADPSCLARARAARGAAGRRAEGDPGRVAVIAPPIAISIWTSNRCAVPAKNLFLTLYRSTLSRCVFRSALRERARGHSSVFAHFWQKLVARIAAAHCPDELRPIVPAPLRARNVRELRTASSAPSYLRRTDELSGVDQSADPSYVAQRRARLRLFERSLLLHFTRAARKSSRGNVSEGRSPGPD